MILSDSVDVDYDDKGDDEYCIDIIVVIVESSKWKAKLNTETKFHLIQAILLHTKYKYNLIVKEILVYAKFHYSHKKVYLNWGKWERLLYKETVYKKTKNRISIEKPKTSTNIGIVLVIHFQFPSGKETDF